jgi:ferredoxin hydrogenase large subunit/hydrogenase large subunit
MGRKLTLSPVTRVEGHLAVSLDIESNRITNAFVAGEMFRGFEVILRGRDPLDAQHITQRICGVCPVEHGVASVLAQESAMGIRPAENGRVIRNLIQGANFIMSHITHFYLLSGLDFLDVGMIVSYSGREPALLALQAWVKSQLASRSVLPAAPFLPRYAAEYLTDPAANFGALSHYLEALEVRKLAHRMGALFAGKLPHAATLIPGGVTEKVTALAVAEFRTLLDRIREFIAEAYLPDVIAISRAFPDYFKTGQGCGNFLAYGAFPETSDSQKKLLPAGVVCEGKFEHLNPEWITEDVAQSFFSSASGLRPAAGETDAAPGKTGAYSWIKAPRYQKRVMEVGPLARLMVAFGSDQGEAVRSAAKPALEAIDRTPSDLVSVMGRHVARALECQFIADRCGVWLDQLVPDAPACNDFMPPDAGEGVGLTEAARGALGHWIEIRNGKISRYQCVVPTTWNCSPRDDEGRPGALEQALAGTSVLDPENPIEAARVIRSFDPCLACAVH